MRNKITAFVFRKKPCDLAQFESFKKMQILLALPIIATKQKLKKFSLAFSDVLTVYCMHMSIMICTQKWKIKQMKLISIELI